MMGGYFSKSYATVCLANAVGFELGQAQPQNVYFPYCPNRITNPGHFTYTKVEQSPPIEFE